MSGKRKSADAHSTVAAEATLSTAESDGGQQLVVSSDERAAENSPPLSAADWHAEGASVVYRYFYEAWRLHNAAVEARYAPLGLFRSNPDAFPGGQKRWSETFDRFFAEVKDFKPPLFYEEWPRVRAVIEEWRASSTPEALVNDSLQQSLAARIAEELKSVLREGRALVEAYKALTPAHFRKICEHARERLITIGQYERENIHAAKIGAPGFPVLSGRYDPKGLLTAIWALADRVGTGWPEIPLYEFFADEAFGLLGGLMRWCDQRQSELDRAPGLLGVWRPSPQIAQPAAAAAPLPVHGEDRADGAADARKKNGRKKPLPENEDARRLALELARKLPAGEKSRNQIAAEFAAGDFSRASSLLRIIRKYPDLKSMVDRADPKKK